MASFRCLGFFGRRDGAGRNGVPRCRSVALTFKGKVMIYTALLVFMLGADADPTAAEIGPFTSMTQCEAAVELLIVMSPTPIIKAACIVTEDILRAPIPGGDMFDPPPSIPGEPSMPGEDFGWEV